MKPPPRPLRDAARSPGGALAARHSKTWRTKCCKRWPKIPARDGISSTQTMIISAATAHRAQQRMRVAIKPSIKHAPAAARIATASPRRGQTPACAGYDCSRLCVQRSRHEHLARHNGPRCALGMATPCGPAKGAPRAMHNVPSCALGLAAQCGAAMGTTDPRVR